MTGKELVPKEKPPEVAAGRAFLSALERQGLSLPEGEELSEEVLEQIGNQLFRIQSEAMEESGRSFLEVDLNILAKIAKYFWEP